MPAVRLRGRSIFYGVHEGGHLAAGLTAATLVAGRRCKYLHHQTNTFPQVKIMAYFLAALLGGFLFFNSQATPDKAARIMEKNPRAKISWRDYKSRCGRHARQRCAQRPLQARPSRRGEFHAGAKSRRENQSAEQQRSAAAAHSNNAPIDAEYENGCGRDRFGFERASCAEREKSAGALAPLNCRRAISAGTICKSARSI